MAISAPPSSPPNCSLLLQALGGCVAGKRKKVATSGKPKHPPSTFFVFMSGFRQEYQMSSLFVLVDQDTCGGEGQLALALWATHWLKTLTTLRFTRNDFTEDDKATFNDFTEDNKATFNEARCMTKARRLGVPTPVLYVVDPVLHTLTFEHVDGLFVKDALLRFGSNGVNEECLNDIATQIGNAIGKLHDGGLVHGDLTTSNMMIKNSNNQLVLIDFGLSFTSTIPKDKAVDLYVLERALISMQSSCGEVMEKILAAYRKASKQWCSTRNKLAQVRQRGRKRTMVG
ncbi:TP53-regulating kinase [Zea mays]|uniref:non-specific serine/threonine protein kinase n=2 Tax=Zea mays TaxID=4577 RepID=A0A3L6DL53_MAIZE|nr:TP53-regulating kinase [Zea mays]